MSASLLYQANSGGGRLLLTEASVNFSSTRTNTQKKQKTLTCFYSQQSTLCFQGFSMTQRLHKQTLLIKFTYILSPKTSLWVVSDKYSVLAVYLWIQQVVFGSDALWQWRHRPAESEHTASWPYLLHSRASTDKISSCVVTLLCLLTRSVWQLRFNCFCKKIRLESHLFYSLTLTNWMKKFVLSHNGLRFTNYEILNELFL